MLDAVRLGGQIEIFASDDLRSIKEVFAEFMRTPDFYELPPDTQEYARDVLVAVSTAEAPTEDYENLMASKKVFPRPTGKMDPASVSSAMHAPGSLQAQNQVAQEQAANAQKSGSIADAERLMSRRAEGLMSNMRQGGGTL
jgi:hypothetical protein